MSKATSRFAATALCFVVSTQCVFPGEAFAKGSQSKGAMQQITPNFQEQIYTFGVAPTGANTVGEKPLEQINGLKKGRLLGCKTRSNCVSTSSINSLEKYGRPWTFATQDADSEFDQLVSVIKAQDYLTLAEADKSKLYIRAEAKSAVPPTGIDDVEFLLNPIDKLITYRTNSRELVFAGTTMVGDGGSNKNRLANLQRKLGVKEMALEDEAEDAMKGNDFFSYQRVANSPSAINLEDNSTPTAPAPAAPVVEEGESAEGK